MARTQQKLKFSGFTLHVIFSICLLFATAAWAEEEAYPQFLEMPSYIYDDYLVAYDRVFTKEAVPYWWAVGLSTAALVAVDDKFISGSQRIARKLGISSEDNTTTMIRYKNLEIFRGPTDLGSALYFIGDGWTHGAIAAGFLATGWLAENDKTYNVGFQLIEGMISTTIATQTLKHITGRESPSHATAAGGRWDLFPNQIDYHKSIPAYDAFPSGHVAVATMTLTVIAKNYPDNAWIVPTGSTLIALLGFQMMNNEVHWASDYPLAIALGYTFGTIAFERGQNSMQEVVGSQDVSILPVVDSEQVGLVVNYAF